MSVRLDREKDRKSFRETYGEWAIVAGASEGLGAAFCRDIARTGINLIMLARREGPLQSLASELEEEFGITAIAHPMDLSHESVVEDLASATEGRDIGLLVYNAAASTIGEFLETDVESKLMSLYVNCRGPLLLTQEFAAKMAERGKGGVVLMSSMSAFQGTGMLTTYAATKAFNRILGEGLWEEFKPRGVDVVVCAAGATSTPNYLETTPEDKQAKGFPLTPERVARRALEKLDAGPITVPGALNKFAASFLQRVMSRRQAVKFFSSKTRDMYDDG